MASAPRPPALHTETVGSGSPLVLIHGFTQTGRSWRPIAESLSSRYRVSMIDAPGHGGSSPLTVDLAGAARLVGEAGGRAIYAGYSMGARLALHLALQSPELVVALVLLGSTAGIDDPVERQARRVHDERLAETIESIGVEAFVEQWLAGPLFAGLAGDPAGRADRTRNTAAGLASSLRLAGTGAQQPLWDRLAELRMPTLILAGELDLKFSEIGRAMASAIGPTASYASIPAAGHASHLEQPAAFLRILTAWLDELEIGD
jgi:2-succinyl-6-hydroxy-2,4-cyclohexadiene-1-carboxylate synthase